MAAIVGMLVPMAGWVTLLIVGVILGLLLALAVAVKATSGGGVGGGTPPPPPAWEGTRQQLVALMRQLEASEYEPTAEECAQVKALFQQMKDQGAPSTTTVPLETAINQLCPGD